MSLIQMSISAGLLVIAVAVIRRFALDKLPSNTFLVLWAVALFRLLVPVQLPSPFGAIAPLPLFAPTPTTTTPIILATTGYVADVQSIPWLTIVWVTGMVGLAGFFVVIHIKSYKELRFATKIHGLGVCMPNRHITIKQSNRILTPIATGLFRPSIILPETLDLSDHNLLRHILTHEYVHIRRLDTLWKIILVVALCIHWFNPLVWLMFILANKDIEITCDQLTLRRLGHGENAAYAHSLINMAEHKNAFAAQIYNNFSKNITVERIEVIMKNKKKSILGVSLAFLLVAILSFSTMIIFANENQPTYESAADEVYYDYESAADEVYYNEEAYYPEEIINETVDIVSVDEAWGCQGQCCVCVDCPSGCSR
ncbi:MAG: M56 family metallopeptidase [Defluviitaleaceae bacterium]|nr:M56 family metallopeptidase [Defluviitaleaceae bacterium]